MEVGLFDVETLYDFVQIFNHSWRGREEYRGINERGGGGGGGLIARKNFFFFAIRER